VEAEVVAAPEVVEEVVEVEALYPAMAPVVQLPH